MNENVFENWNNLNILLDQTTSMFQMQDDLQTKYNPNKKLKQLLWHRFGYPSK